MIFLLVKHRGWQLNMPKYNVFQFHLESKEIETQKGGSSTIRIH